jgi:hypothetical protein
MRSSAEPSFINSARFDVTPSQNEPDSSVLLVFSQPPHHGEEIADLTEQSRQFRGTVLITNHCSFRIQAVPADHRLRP